MTKNSTYLEYKKSLDHLKQKISSKKKFCCLIVGESDYFIRKAQKQLLAELTDHSYDPQILDCTVVSEERIIDALEASPLFVGEEAVFITRLDARKTLANNLVKKGFLGKARQSIIFSFHGKTPPKALTDLFKKEITIPCQPLTIGDIFTFINDISQIHGLELDRSGQQMLVESIGPNPVNLENELINLNLAFKIPGESHVKITTTQLENNLNILREDHIFTLENHLLKQNTLQATILIEQLLMRGQSPLAILGVLSNFCRKTLKINDLKDSQLAPREIAKQAHLPPWLIGDFLKFIRGIPTNNLLLALIFCQEADFSLKSTKSDPNYVLWQIIDCFQASQR